MTEKDKGIDKRLKLLITEVGERKPVGDKGAVKLNFKGKGEDGDKELSYFTFSQRLFETIEQGKGQELECDVNISNREWDGNTITDRKVIQIYINGEPVGKKHQNGKESPETIASTEAQKRADITAQLWIAGKLKDDDPEVTKLRKWLMEESPTVATDAKKKPSYFGSGPAPKTTAEQDWEALGRIDFDPQDLEIMISDAKFKDITVKSYCISQYKVDANGQPLDNTLEIVPFVASLKLEDRKKLFDYLQERGGTQ